MENCSIKKLNGTVNNNNLQYFGGLIVNIHQKGDNSQKISFAWLKPDVGTAVSDVTIKVVSGNIELFKTDGTTSLGTEGNITGVGSPAFRALLSGNGGKILIKNFVEVCTLLGKQGTDTGFSAAFNDNRPYATINADELSYLPITELNLGNNCYLTGDISNVKLDDVKYFCISNPSDISVNGKLPVFPSLQTFEAVYADSTKNQIEYNISTLVGCSALKDFNTRGGIIKGGDLYTLISNKSELSYVQGFAQSGSIAPTCSYTNGNTIPTCVISKFDFHHNPNAAMDKPNTVALLTLFKDGISASKISLPATGTRITVQSGVDTDSDVTALVSQLSGLGVTITFV